MNAVVVYASRSGNTRDVAEEIADGLRQRMNVTVASVEGAPVIADDVDLVVIGGPTEGRRATPPMVEFLARLPDHAFAGRRVAVFDTRLDWPHWLGGSAAEQIRGEVERMGARIPVATESFLVTMKPEMKPGELTRARAWGAQLATAVQEHVTAGAPR